MISCANKNSKSKLTFQGRGTVEVKLKDGKNMQLDNVTYAKDLARNLLSLRKFVDKGLSIYLDNKCIDIYDPLTQETVIAGMYNKPFWEIDLKRNLKDSYNNKTDEIKRIFVNVTTRSGRITEPIRKCKNKSTEKLNNEQIIEPVKTVNTSKLLNTIHNTKIEYANKLTVKGINSSIELEKEHLHKLNTVIVWHARLGHMSAPYMKKFKSMYPEMKNFKDSDFDEGIIECETCFIAKMSRLPFTKTRHRESQTVVKNTRGRYGIHKSGDLSRSIQIYCGVY